jgi:HlyD family secretion protein
VDPGQTVAASFQTPQLFVIAQDLRKMRVYADVDEADVGKLREGMTAETQVDAFPGEKFKGKVSQVRFNPNNVSGVVTYQAIIEVDNNDLKLRPGMTATVTVITHQATKVMRVPNAALRFKPTPRKKKKDGTDAAPPKALPKLEPHTGRLWIPSVTKPGRERIEPMIVKIGGTDGIFTEIIDSKLKENDKLVIDETDEKKAGESGGRRRRMF